MIPVFLLNLGFLRWNSVPGLRVASRRYLAKCWKRPSELETRETGPASLTDCLICREVGRNSVTTMNRRIARMTVTVILRN